MALIKRDKDTNTQQSNINAGSASKSDNSMLKLRGKSDVKKLGEILTEHGVITQSQLDECLATQRSNGGKLGDILIEKGFIDDIQLARAFVSQLNTKFIDIDTERTSDEVANVVKDPAILRKYSVIPYSIDGNILNLVMADPYDSNAIDEITIITGYQIRPYVSTARSIRIAIDKKYGSKEVSSLAQKFVEETVVDDRQEFDNTQHADSHIANIVLNFMEQAVRSRASDIHIEPLQEELRVRYRIDGQLINKGNYTIKMLSGILARIKVLAGLDISEKRIPQDGRLEITVDSKEYDMRVSTTPTVNGEKAVLRIASKEILKRDKRDLGLTQQDLKRFDKLLSNPNGLIVVTGPTGSGKSTTLYTALNELNTENVNIITVEDPVEAEIVGINQVNIDIKKGLTFATALRAFLRQDPDIIMVGEMRDDETAKIAIEASITGHLVVSTLHTNSAVATISRLTQMGIPHYLLADALVGVVAQRLVRRLCSCKKKRLATDKEKVLLNVNRDVALSIYEPCGCAKCNNTGYSGRIGIYEILVVTPEIADAIASRRGSNEIHDIAVKQGLVSLASSAASQVCQGVTSLQEMNSVVYDPSMADEDEVDDETFYNSLNFD